MADLMQCAVAGQLLQALNDAETHMRDTHLWEDLQLEDRVTLIEARVIAGRLLDEAQATVPTPREASLIASAQGAANAALSDRLSLHMADWREQEAADA